MEKKCEMAELDLRSKVSEILILERGIEHLERQTKALHDRCAAISIDNTQLHIRISEEEEHAHMVVEVFNTYRNKMESHREAVLHAARHTQAHAELEKKRALVRMLTQKKEELKEDLENPNGNMVKMAKREVDALKKEISVTRKTIAGKRQQLQKELESHAQIKKDIEIQNKRCDAIIKRLHCQLSRAQAAHRQMSEEIYRMETQLAELKRQQESSQDSASASLHRLMVCNMTVPLPANKGVTVLLHP
ncbi:coiled-coil domain-containing protein 122 [Mastacembelus armatus]|uniref:coiled-coil domain-containing protein 122 n=1 Tax=Mastacembelus armatus TaxID=205130 RepID=UPI0014369880|nr:coiled-coil domain-containing protein 122 [Mastacembelus armatus]